MLGDLFVGALKAVAPILVFFLVMSSLSNARNSHGGVIRTVIILYMLSTLLAAVIAVFASMAFPIELTLAEAAEDAAAPGGVLEVLQTLIMNVVANPVSSLANANYLGILAWAVLLGIAFRSAGEHTRQVLQDISSGISTLVTWIIDLAPFGILGLVFGTVSTSGLDIFTQYGLLLVLLVGCMLVVTFITNPVLVYWCIRKNPFPLIFKCLKRSAITAFLHGVRLPISRSIWRSAGRWGWIRIRIR